MPETLHALIAARLDGLPADGPGAGPGRGRARQDVHAAPRWPHVSGRRPGTLEQRLRDLVRSELFVAGRRPAFPGARAVRLRPGARPRGGVRHAGPARPRSRLTSPPPATSRSTPTRRSPGCSPSHYLAAYRAAPRRARRATGRPAGRRALRTAADRSNRLGSHDRALGYLDRRSRSPVATPIGRRCTWRQVRLPGADPGRGGRGHLAPRSLTAPRVTARPSCGPREAGAGASGLGHSEAAVSRSRRRRSSSRTSTARPPMSGSRRRCPGRTCGWAATRTPAVGRARAAGVRAARDDAGQPGAARHPGHRAQRRGAAQGVLRDAHRRPPARGRRGPRRDRGPCPDQPGLLPRTRRPARRTGGPRRRFRDRPPDGPALDLSYLAGNVAECAHLDRGLGRRRGVAGPTPSRWTSTSPPAPCCAAGGRCSPPTGANPTSTSWRRRSPPQRWTTPIPGQRGRARCSDRAGRREAGRGPPAGAHRGR